MRRRPFLLWCVHPSQLFSVFNDFFFNPFSYNTSASSATSGDCQSSVHSSRTTIMIKWVEKQIKPFSFVKAYDWRHAAGGQCSDI